MNQQMVFFFGQGEAEGDASMKALLGGKGANLAEMTNLGFPVPPGFTISTECCAHVSANGAWPAGLEAQIDQALARLEKAFGKRLGDAADPLLVSVRSGAAVSMPGMMDTVLNLGLNREVCLGLAAKSGNARFAWDSYRRFIQMFGDVVCGVPHQAFEEVLEAFKQERGAREDIDLDTGALQDLVAAYLALFEQHTGEAFPTDPRDQLHRAINAVFASWDNDRAVTYRRLNNIHGLQGTAVNVQAMVFGNFGADSGTGVCFTRDPATGENRFYGEFLANAQGEDVVAGIRTPRPIEQIDSEIPDTYARLLEVKDRLEGHYRDMQDIEFTVQEGALYLLQTRTGKRTAAAAVRVAVEMVAEGLIDQETALLRVDAASLEQLLHPEFDPAADKVEIASGLPASPGAASGRIYFTAGEAEEAAERGEAVILVREETSPEDIGGMHVARGILTARGGMTSHAAVVARGMGTCCVAGCSALQIDEAARRMRVGERELAEGDWLSLDGTSGKVYLGQLPTVDAELSGNFDTLMAWADGHRRLVVRGNADTPADCATARRLGAEGIGLCRTEHMFFDPVRILAVREMILAEDVAGRQAALDKLLPYQREDFVGIFRAMDGLPVTIRLLDPPLHEFLPATDAAVAELAGNLGVSPQWVTERVKALGEVNPMLGHRGCRLGLTHPEIYRMQVRAITEAAAQCAGEGLVVRPEIMHPLVATRAELAFLRTLTEEVIAEVRGETGFAGEVTIGTMIEVPRAALCAGEIAAEADFFSFGTNDLTQMTFGFSRDDTGQILRHYQETGVLPRDPFASLDIDGVGALVQGAVARGRAASEGLKCGICGEHGGDPDSIVFCEAAGLDYVSCSPYRVPVARLAAAQAALRAQAG